MLFRKLLCLFSLSLLLCGCSDNPGKWPQEKLEEYVKESLIEQGMNITEISLSSAGEASYSGTAVDSEGEKLALEVKQDPEAGSLTWDAKGDRGSFLNGSFQLK